MVRKVAILHTTLGDIKIKLFDRRAPRTVNNFIELATGQKNWTNPATGEIMKKPLYDDLKFHRVIEEFVIQTGDPSGTGREGPGYTFDDEFHDDLNHDRPGVVSMANNGPNTNGSQFFITLGEHPHLNGHHTVFGQVIDGMNVVNRIGNVETDENDRPTRPILLESIDISRCGSNSTPIDNLDYNQQGETKVYDEQSNRAGKSGNTKIFDNNY